jgi:hypothetical protein
MSTRSVTNFGYGDTVVAKVYRHPDGYPESMLPDLDQFFEDVKSQTTDTRFTDASYLAAKWVVWLADMFSKGAKLDFISVGVMMENPDDIEYEYFVDCDDQDEDGNPVVTFKKV